MSLGLQGRSGLHEVFYLDYAALVRHNASLDILRVYASHR